MHMVRVCNLQGLCYRRRRKEKKGFTVDVPQRTKQYQTVFSNNGLFFLFFFLGGGRGVLGGAFSKEL